MCLTERANPFLLQPLFDAGSVKRMLLVARKVDNFGADTLRKCLYADRAHKVLIYVEHFLVQIVLVDGKLGLLRVLY